MKYPAKKFVLTPTQSGCAESQPELHGWSNRVGSKAVRISAETLAYSIELGAVG
jgi:hypothetical protein